MSDLNKMMGSWLPWPCRDLFDIIHLLKVLSKSYTGEDNFKNMSKISLAKKRIKS